MPEPAAAHVDHEPTDRPETAISAEAPETAIASSPGRDAMLEDLMETLRRGDFSPLYIATCAAVAGALVPRGLSATSGTSAVERDYVQWAVRTAVEIAHLTQSSALELQEAIQQGAAPPWATLIQGASLDPGSVE